MTRQSSDEYASVCEIMPTATKALEQVLPAGLVVVLHLYKRDDDGNLHGHYASNASVMTAMQAMQDTMENLIPRK